MGLSRAAISWLIEEAQRKPFSGTLLTLGVQNVFLDEAAFEALAARTGFQLRPAGPADATALIDGTISARTLFIRLGFDRVVATDVDDFEGCDFLFDLNADEVPAGHRGAYDMVLDAGTFEHVFHLPNAFANAVAFTKVGGRIVHMSPSSNHIDHGFHMFSPTLFWDYYLANGLELPRFDLFRYRSSADDGSLWDFGTYTYGALNKKMFGGLGGGCFGLGVVAEKNVEADGRVIPQQSLYTRAWDAKASPGLQAGTRAGRTGPGPLKRAMRRMRAWVPLNWRLGWKSLRQRFPLPVRRRF